MGGAGLDCKSIHHPEDSRLLAGKYRAVINAACMLGQSKNFYQAEIDSACETIDFLRYNAAFASKIYGIQPKSGPNQINSVEYRPSRDSSSP